MAVNLQFTCDSRTLSESTALDFGTVVAGQSSAIKTVTVTNLGDSDAQQVVINPVEATIVNGFASNIQVGTAQETYLAQKFAPASDSGTWYGYAVVGTGKNYTNKVGGTLQNTGGSDTFATKWEPPASGTNGQKLWGNAITSVYW